MTLPAALACSICALSAIAGEPPRRRIDMSRVLDAGTSSSDLPDIAITRTPSDPLPLVEAAQWVFDLRWDRGDVWLLGQHLLQLPKPRATPRAMGRFALELFEGLAVIERVRFDFPLLGAPEADAALGLASGLRTRVGVIFPATKHGTRLELWDRATNRRWSVPWPPLERSPSDAGATSMPADSAGPS